MIEETIALTAPELASQEKNKIAFDEAMKKGLMVHGEPDWNKQKFIPVHFYGLRNPEHAKTDEDYLRLTFQEEDEEKRKDLEHMTLTMSEMKRLP